ncbi:hypothetical protein DENSPDRAFT_5082 [Dentipellis sp. KUC8613]|nr:hypothetical protein DENSPDRAFT_5082 [Dentipellis sp. KUC8613]
MTGRTTSLKGLPVSHNSGMPDEASATYTVGVGLQASKRPSTPPDPRSLSSPCNPLSQTQTKAPPCPPLSSPRGASGLQHDVLRIPHRAQPRARRHPPLRAIHEEQHPPALQPALHRRRHPALPARGDRRVRPAAQLHLRGRARAGVARLPAWGLARPRRAVGSAERVQCVNSPALIRLRPPAGLKICWRRLCLLRRASQPRRTPCSPASRSSRSAPWTCSRSPTAPPCSCRTRCGPPRPAGTRICSS